MWTYENGSLALLCLMRRLQKDKGGLVERLTQIQTSTRSDHVWPEAWSRIGKSALNREKNKSGQLRSQNSRKNWFEPKHLRKFKRQNSIVLRKRVNQQEWNLRRRKIMKTILQEKVKIHQSTTTWFTNLFLCHSQCKFLVGHKRGTTQKQNPLCFINRHLSSKERGVRTTISEVSRSSRTPW